MGAVFFGFFRRERLYFLLMVLCLLVSALSQSFDSPHLPDSQLSSDALVELQQKAKESERVLGESAAWLKALEKNPDAVLTGLLISAIFAGLFIGGMAMGLGIALFAPIRNYFEKASDGLSEASWPLVLLFRAGVLIYIAVLALGLLTGTWIEFYLYDEQALGVFQTFIIDLFACFAIFAVIQSAGLSARQVFGKIQLGKIWVEVGRGAAEYIRIFPWFILALSGVLIIAGLFHYEPPPHPLVEIFLNQEKGLPLIFYAALSLAVVAGPVMEEIFFRGFLYRLFRGNWGSVNAAVLSAALFSALHGSWFTFLPIFVLGMALARLYEQRGNLIACWTFHILHNILFTAYFFTAKNIIEAFYG